MYTRKLNAQMLKFVMCTKLVNTVSNIEEQFHLLITKGNKKSN